MGTASFFLRQVATELVQYGIQMIEGATGRGRLIQVILSPTLSSSTSTMTVGIQGIRANVTSDYPFVPY